jgi:hypothetical protein
MGKTLLQLKSLPIRVEMNSLIRLLVTTTFFLTLLFSMGIALIHAQPYDDGALRAFLISPPACSMPCFLGIRPGITTVEEVTAILQEHEWVASMHIFEATDGRGVTSITAAWSIEKPVFIDSSEALWLGVEDNTVQTILITTTIPLGSIWLVLGNPEVGAVRGDAMLPATSPSVLYQATYSSLNMFFTVVYPCGSTTIWHVPVNRILRYDLASDSIAQGIDLPSHAYKACRNLMNGR